MSKTGEKDRKITNFIEISLFLVAGVQLYNRHFVSVCLSVSPSVQSDFSEPVGDRKLKFGTNVVHMTI